MQSLNNVLTDNHCENIFLIWKNSLLGFVPVGEVISPQMAPHEMLTRKIINSFTTKFY